MTFIGGSIDMDSIDDFLTTRQPTAIRPLLGLTVLLIEDSRFASEAVRLLCVRSGARIRRADSLENARKHLAVYRPSVVIVDAGLPDGSGLPLIEQLVLGTPRIDVILGTSGDPGVEEKVLAMGADGFLPKPLENLAAFQTAILKHLPKEQQPPGPRLVHDETVAPDMIAYHDDLTHVAEVLGSSDAAESVDYVTQFLGGVASSAADRDINRAVQHLKSLREQGAPLQDGIIALSSLVQDRLNNTGPI